MIWEDRAEVTFCCDGMGMAAGHDPWCDRADPVEQEHWINSQHLGVVDMSFIGGPYYCDDPHCCGEDDDDRD